MKKNKVRGETVSAIDGQTENYPAQTNWKIKFPKEISSTAGPDSWYRTSPDFMKGKHFEYRTQFKLKLCNWSLNWLKKSGVKSLKNVYVQKLQFKVCNLER